MEDESNVIEVEGQKLAMLVNRAHKGSSDCIVACHGLLSSKDSTKYRTLGDRGIDRGINVARFDFRGLGESEGGLEDSYASERLKDVRAVMDRMEEWYKFKNVGLFGSSFGGYVTLLHGAVDKRVKAMVCLATPFQMIGLLKAREGDLGQKGSVSEELGPAFIEDLRRTDAQMLEAVKRIKAPTLMVHGDKDDIVPIEHGRRIFEGLECEKKLLVIEEGDHIFSDPGHLERVISAALEWFGSHFHGH